MAQGNYTTYKRAVFWILFSLASFLLINFVIWKVWTEDLLTSGSGDLARLSYSTDVKSFRAMVDNLPARHISMDKYSGQPVDVLTIGDSFSQGGGGGLNRYYQDHIASISNVTVLNVQPYEERLDNGVLIDAFDPVRTLIVLLNSGLIAKINPKYIVLESVQRSAGMRLAREINFRETVSLERLKRFYRKDSASLYLNQQKLFFVNNGNGKIIYNKIIRLFYNKEVGGVRREHLSRPLFQSSSPYVLLYLKDDVNTIPQTTGEVAAAKINNNLNILATMLDSLGIKLYFMPAADKYDIYADYIIGNRYSRSDFFSQMRAQEKRYKFIDTELILGELLKKDVKDVYYADDTHWSWKASNAIFSQVRFGRK